MKIKLEKHSDNLYHADFLDLPPNSSPTGAGVTKHEAVAHLIYNIASSNNFNHLIDRIGQQGLEIVEVEPKQPLYARLHLSLDCVMELRLTGEVTQEAFDRLLQFLKVTGEVWGLHSEQ